MKMYGSRVAKPLQTLKLSTAYIALAVALTNGAVAANESEIAPMQEIVVTAQKRTQNILEVPQTVSALSEDFLESAIIEDAEGIEKFVAGMTRMMSSAPLMSRTFIRGVGSLQTTTASDASVGYYVDGILVPKMLQGIKLFDVQQVEVLKGPQGTLYGRGAQAGVISITTKKPTDELGGTFSGSVGDLSFYNLSGMLNVPISDKLAVRFGGAYEELGTDLMNVVSRDLDSRSENTNAAASLFYKPNEIVNVEAGFQYSKDFAIFPVQGGYRIGDERWYGYDTASNKASGWLAHIKVDVDLGDVTLTSISSYANTKNHLLQDSTDAVDLGGFIPPAFLNDTTIDYSDWSYLEKEFSQEFRLSGETDAGLNWVAGLNYYKNNHDSMIVQSDFFTAGGLLDGVRDHRLDRQGFAVFGDVTVPLGEKFSVSAGLRYSEDDYKLSHVDTPLNGNCPSVAFGRPAQLPLYVDQQKRSYDAISGRLALSYEISDYATTYLSFSRGYKTGGYPNFSLATAYGYALNSFEETYTYAYEWGLKYQNPSGSLYAAVSAFYNDVKDEQVSGYDSTVPYLVLFENVDVETYGVELEFNYYPVEDFLLRGAFSYLETEAQNTVSTVAKGDRITGVPKTTASLFTQYTFNTSINGMELAIIPNADISYVGNRTYPSTLFGTGMLDSYITVSAGLTFSFDYVSLSLRAENLFNEDYELLGRPSVTTDSYIFGPSRRFWATLKASF